jgi:membrane protease YdiL (CAAX protease family)
MNSRWTRPFIGVAIAIGITTAMDATGLTNFSALPLLPLLVVCWRRDRFSRATIGFRGAPARDFGVAMLHPIAVLGAIAALTVVTGAAHPSPVDLRTAAVRVLRVALGTFVVVMVTEEGFFRGWLWASVERVSPLPGRPLAWTTVAFALWHVSWVTLPPESRLPPGQIPIFLVNAALLGVIWGLLRSASGSIVVASLAHGLWNGVDYVLYGAGPRPGLLGVTATVIYGPEVGLAGIAANLAFALALWRSTRGRAPPNAEPAEQSAGSPPATGVPSRSDRRPAVRSEPAR